MNNMEKYTSNNLFVFTIKLKDNKEYYIGKNFQFILLNKDTTFKEIEKNAKLYSRRGAKIIDSMIWDKKRLKIEKEFGVHLDRTSYCTLDYLARQFNVNCFS